MVDLRDQHNVRAKQNGPQQQQPLAEQRGVVVAQRMPGRAIGQPQRTEQNREFERLRNIAPVGGEVGNDARTEQQHPEDGKGVGEERRANALRRHVLQDGALGAGLDPAARHPVGQLFGKAGEEFLVAQKSSLVTDPAVVLLGNHRRIPGLNQSVRVVAG